MPTKHGLVFALMMFALLIGAANYDNSLAYLLTFALVSVALVSLLHTYRNLAGLTLKIGAMPRVFAGDVGKVPLIFDNSLHRDRIAVDIQFPAACPDEAPARNVQRIHVVKRDSTVAHLPIRFFTRGQFQLARIIVSTRFPFGLFRAWSYLDTHPKCVVYPCAAGHLPVPQAAAQSALNGMHAGEGTEDFSGLRNYQPGDSPRSIHWKAVARGHDVPVKLFEGGGAYESVLDWRLIADNDMEKRLEQLCAWILEADKADCSYSLILPSEEVGKNRGAEHRERCLSALARMARQPGSRPAETPAQGWFTRRFRAALKAKKASPASQSSASSE
ncbi:MAG: DUF58 domain-containing protein [Gammaproteobacteria bacterium]|nr:DUF58 domain-containing protein [Gammaproteobacteria bacterium]